MKTTRRNRLSPGRLAPSRLAPSHASPNRPRAGASLRVSSSTSQVWRWSDGEFHTREAWAPPVNVYRVAERIELCVDLAGVDRRCVHVEVQPGRVTIRGTRHTPESTASPPPNPTPTSSSAPKQDRPGKTPSSEPASETATQIVIMEINHGPFRRDIHLPDVFHVDHVESHYRDGLLWVFLPLR